MEAVNKAPPQRDVHVTCGIELELLLTPNPALSKVFTPEYLEKTYKSRSPTNYRLVSIILNETFTSDNYSFLNVKAIAKGPQADEKTGETINPHRDAVENKTLYQSWTVCDDISLKTDPTSSSQFALEIVSRVLKPTFPPVGNHTWADEIALVYNALEQYFVIGTNQTCSTHVHFKAFEYKEGASAPEKFSFSKSTLQNVCKSIVYWDPAVQLSASRERKFPTGPGEQRYNRNNLELNSDYTAPVATDLLADKIGLAAIFLKIEKIINEQSANFSAIVEYMCTKVINKGWVWNFRPLLPQSDMKGTVEFRLPQGSKDVFQAVHWATWATTFALAAKHITELGAPEADPKTNFQVFRKYMEKHHSAEAIGGGFSWETTMDVNAK